MNLKCINVKLLFFIGISFSFSTTLNATEIIHRFENPNFGGNPLNGSVFLNEANTQNKIQDPDAKSVTRTTQTPMQRFISSLQSSILSRLSGTTVASLFDENGNLKLGATVNFDPTGDGSSIFAVTVGEAAVEGNVTITISDGITDTSLTVPIIPTVTP